MFHDVPPKGAHNSQDFKNLVIIPPNERMNWKLYIIVIHKEPQNVGPTFVKTGHEIKSLDENSTWQKEGTKLILTGISPSVYYVPCLHFQWCSYFSLNQP
jgi:hypothetical protein